MIAFLGDHRPVERIRRTLVRIFAALEALGVKEYVRYDPNIIRGLLYYTGTVFEAFDMTGGVRRAILGGGRYDNLLAQVGGDPLPAIGFAMGDMVINLMLQELRTTPAKLGRSPADVLVTVFSPDLQPASMKLAADLRAAGLNVVCSSGSQLNFPNSSNSLTGWG